MAHQNNEQPPAPRGVLKSEHRGLVQTVTSKPQLAVSDSIGLEGGLRTCISNKFPDDAGVVGLGTTLREPLL